MTEQGVPSSDRCSGAPPQALAGLGVMVTRPLHQANALAERMAAAGAQVVCFPVLEIAYLDASPAFARIAARLDEFAALVFVSANAVTGWMRLLHPHCQGLPRGNLFAVGRATAHAMERSGLGSPLQPLAGSGSAALLERPELSAAAIAKRRVLIVRGVGGRELLGNTLAERGATVEYVEVYRRARPRVPAEALLALRSQVHAIVITSAESLHNLFAMGGAQARPWLRGTLLVTVSERIAELARSMGVKHPPLVADDASDEAIVAALHRHWICAPRRTTNRHQ